MKCSATGTMGLITQTRFLSYKIKVFNQGNSYRSFFPYLFFVIIYTCIFLQASEKVAAASSHSHQRNHTQQNNFPPEQTPNLPENANQENCGNQDLQVNNRIAELANTSLDLSEWISYPSIGLQELVKRYGFYVLHFLNSSDLDKYQFNPVLGQIWQSSLLPLLPLWNPGFNFSTPIERIRTDIDKVAFVLVTGGQPITIHADSRYQVPEILAKSRIKAIAAVDGTFFSMRFLTSNTMIGPVLSQSDHQFVPGNNSENQKLAGRPLVLLSHQDVNFIPFNPSLHNTLEGLQAEKPDVTDIFVAAAWLVKDGQAAPPESFKSLFGAEIWRRRAFWGITQFGTPIIGITTNYVDSANLAKILVKAGLRNAVMLDGGASTSLVYRGEIFVDYLPRPVPHAVALIPPSTQPNNSCSLVVRKPE